MASDIEAELEAIKVLQRTLEPLAPEVRTRVLDYVFRVLDIMPAAHGAGSPAVPATAATANPQPPVPQSTHAHADIISLKLAKQPSSANQMVALVAYYLNHEAPQTERKNTINADDVRKYFDLGRYPMPNSPNMTLAHARHAGYLDPVERGTYRLNSVGYNLVVHKMGGDEVAANSKSVGRNGRRGRKK